MADVRTFTPDEIDGIRSYCEEQLRDEVARIAVVERDHGACVGLLVELMDGHRLAYAAIANGRDDGSAGKLMVEAIRNKMNERRQAMH
jgi:hypothetical protein